MAMDPAVRNGFAIGFAVVAGLVAHYAWREGGLSRFGAGPEGPGELSAPQASRDPAPKAEARPEARSEPPAARQDAPAEATPPERPAAQRAPSAPAPDQSSAGAPASAPAPAAPALRAADRGPATSGTFDVVRVEPSGDLVVAGRCSGPCDVELLANGRPHGGAKADAQGQWAMTPPTLAPGDYHLALRTRGADGSEQVSEQTVTVSVPRPPSRDEVVVLNHPNAPSRILQTPGPAVAASAEPATAGPQSSPAAAPSRLAIGAVDAESGRFFVQGSAPQGASLRIYLNGALVAQAVAGEDSRWSLRVERGLSPGDYTVRVDRVENAAGKVAERAEARFTYEAPSAAAEENPQPDRTSASATPQRAVATPSASGEGASEPNPATRASGSSPATRGEAAAADAANPVIASLETVKVRRGDSLWRISRTAYGHGRRYTVIFEANDGQIRNPNLIYPDQVFVLPSEPLSPSAAR